MTDNSTTLGARTVPLPRFVSEEARQYMIMPKPVSLSAASMPPISDKEGWRKHIAEVNQMMAMMDQMALSQCQVTIERSTLNGVRIARVTPAKIAPENKGRVLMNIHGGAFVYGEGMVAEAVVAAHLGKIEVIAVDYRVPPDHCFPANIEDSVAVYRALLKSHGAPNIVVYGTSAGGTYTLTTILKIRDLGLPLPAAAGICTPAVELSGRPGYAGDSMYLNDGIDTLSNARPAQPGEGPSGLFANGHSFDDPLISPIYGDYSKGFSPSYVLTGTRDMLLSSSVLIHRKLHNAGVRTELHVFEAMHHGFNVMMHLPEAREATLDMLRFFREQMDIANA